MNPHFAAILRLFHEENVEFLVIGAHALAAHGHVRATLDIDLWVRPTPENARRVWRALERFRAPLSKMEIGDFAEPEVLYQIGVPPSRIDIMTSVTGLAFDAAWPNRLTAMFGDVPAPVLGLADMRTAKRAAGRLKDLADLEELG
ncbi:MAG: hypothetical protein EBX35_08745 [Planctomycetia bacterium]|jgi:hypothetical protein|nr:hypothetical protein [Planctomycetia bacterium]